jgi:hypothetical protein
LTTKAEYGSRPDAFPLRITRDGAFHAEPETALGCGPSAGTLFSYDIADVNASATRLGRFTRGPHVPKGRGAAVK